MERVSQLWVWLSIVLALLVATASLLGLFDPMVYEQETPNWALQAQGQDIGNLIALVPFLVSAFLLGRRSSMAFFIWLGGLLYVVYAYLLYAFFCHFNYLFLVYVSVLGLASYTLLGALLGQDVSKLSRPLQGKSFRLASALLMVISVLFVLLWMADIIPALLTGTVPESIVAPGLWVNPVHVIDLALVLPGMAITSVLLWNKKAIGYVFAVPWLCFSALMASSIVANLSLEWVQGNTDAIPPFVMLSVVAITSVAVLLGFVRPLKETAA